ncbi:uncharacterized protein LOC122352919 isoform X2 [Puntigrus tetrazona]|uniref:uncharacterized protein LOC122352919 isoform X2 n=1 Tax=Puntigrus tetrazona TaxID=1606681 RepID=UPI001C893864|nr:uncharacterized protein LOC122352919 isoform X2 [Puntigrus tetrazona]
MRTATSISFSVLWLMKNSLAVSVTGSVGSNISVSCSYPETYQNNSKYFCQMSGASAPGDLQCVHITRPETRSERGRLALLDDTGAQVLTANISGLAPEDSGKYWCGVDIALLPDFTSEIWITVTKEHPREQTTDPFAEEPGVSYSRFMIMVVVVCLGALFFVCLFPLFLVLKHKSSFVLGRVRTLSNPDGHQRTHRDLPDLPEVQSEKEELYRATNPDYTNTEPTDYADVVSAQTKDQVYTELDRNRQSHVYQSLTADPLQESIYHTLDQTKG